MKRNKSNKSGGLLELCDWCGKLISDGSELYGVAQDSSMINADDPRFDGQRFLTACTYEHLIALREHYRRRPFVDEELWAGKITRALDDASEEYNLDDLTAATGLNPEQVERCIAWLEAQLHRLPG
ncbi:hypothetical protein ACFSKW_25825 [Nonomuraea mangrovi]|uniref:HNH endonuclease n=1 Tax=Nonomuraea mangrovi TaxID=2316207 RepID=A0ABW4T008_9ACTN